MTFTSRRHPSQDWRLRWDSLITGKTKSEIRQRSVRRQVRQRPVRREVQHFQAPLRCSIRRAEVQETAALSPRLTEPRMAGGTCRTGASLLPLRMGVRGILVDTFRTVSTATIVLQGGLVSGGNVLSQVQEPRARVEAPLVVGMTRITAINAVPGTVPKALAANPGAIQVMTLVAISRSAASEGMTDSSAARAVHALRQR